MTDCFNSFEDAAASTPGIQPLKKVLLQSVSNVIVDDHEHMRKNSSPPRARKILKHGTPANPLTHAKDGSMCED